MSVPRTLAAAIAMMLGALSTAEAQADSVVIRVTSPRGAEVRFNGVITFRDARTERKLENVATPFELKVPAQHVDARFDAMDGGALSGEVISFRAGVRRGHATGTVHVGTVNLYYEPGFGFGFGRRFAGRVFP